MPPVFTPPRLAFLAAALAASLAAGAASAQIATSTGISAAPSPSQIGQSITLRATVADAGFRKPDVTGAIAPGSISAGAVHTCAVRQQAGTVVCWGNDSNGQSSVPIDPANDGPIAAAAVTAGLNHTCALNDGMVRCWGIAPVEPGFTTSPFDMGQLVPPGFEATSVAANGWHVCAIGLDTMVSCWRHPETNFDQADVPIDPATNMPITAISVSAGVVHSCAIKLDQTVICWGANVEGINRG